MKWKPHHNKLLPYFNDIKIYGRMNNICTVLEAPKRFGDYWVQS